MQQETCVKLQDIPDSAIPVELTAIGANCWRILSITNNITTPRNYISATFFEYGHTLEAWEVNLLRHTELIADAYTISLELQLAFVTGSDGSAKFGTDGAFGWMMSNLEGERAASGMGPVRGINIDSYRAECSGMLAFLRFLLRVADFTDMVGTWEGTICTDSQSMLDTLFGRGKTGHPAAAEPTSLPTDLQPLHPLISEWDLLIEIRHTLQTLPGVKSVYVKGHQDQQKAYCNLNLMAQTQMTWQANTRRNTIAHIQTH